MRQVFGTKKLLFFLYFILIAYLLINTGIISDDFDAMNRLKDKNLKDVFIPDGYFIETPVEHFTHYIWYYWFRIDNLFVVNILKICYIILSFCLITQFFKIFLDRYTAFWASILFIFFPSHDSAVYSFMTQYISISFCLYLFSFYLAYYNKLVSAFLSALIASFLSYGSTPIALALFVLFALNKQFRKGRAIIIPNIIYMLYFIPVNVVFRLGSPRIIEELSVSAVIKQFILQVLTFIDSMCGPSMWLKIYYSFYQLSVISFVIGLVLIIIFYKIIQEGSKRYNSKLIISFIVLLFFSFLMFAVTGRYPQLAFNLGNRTTIYGSLLLSYLIVFIGTSKKIKTLIFALMIFTILGISDHWKNWNVHQQEVIANIKDNQDLNKYQDSKVIYVSGNQYSKYGPISHIEFFSEDWMVGPVFNLALNKNISAKSLNKRHKYINGYLIDTKYNLKRKVDGYINIYDSEKDSLFKLEVEEINNYIDSLPTDNRHWTQILDIKLMKDLAIRLMPRLKYAL